MALQVSGFSNIDTSSIISQLMQIERQPVVKLEFTKTLLNTRKQALFDINTKLLSVYTAASDLLSSTVWNSKASTSSNTSLLTVTSTSDASPATYQVLINNLAQAHTVASDVQYFTSRGIEPGKAQRVSGDFKITNGSTNKTISIVETDTLYNIRDKINSSGAGVTATIVDNTLRIQRDTTGSTQLTFQDLTSVPVSPGDKNISWNSTFLTVTRTGTPLRATYNFNVSQLAQTHQVASNPQTSAVNPLGLTGTFTINGVSVNVIASDTLTNVKNNINASVPSVTASIDGSNRLIITSNTSGAGGAITAQDTTGNVLQTLGVLLTDNLTFKNVQVVAQDAKFTVNGGLEQIQATNTYTGIAGLQIDLVQAGTSTVSVADVGKVLENLGVLSGGSIKNQLIAAQNANISVDGQSVIRSTNSISDAINGVTLALKGTTGATPVTVEVKTDVDTIKSKITAFVNAYNSAMDVISAKLNEKRVINATTESDKLKGALYNDSQLYRIKNTLRKYATEVVSELPNTMNNLSLMGIKTASFTSGITLDTSGKLNIDDAKLTSALQSNLNDVKELFVHNQSVTPFDYKKSGIAARVKTYLNSVTQYGGTLLSRQDSIQREIDLVGKSIDRWNLRLTKIEANYKKQFSLMEQSMAMMQSQMDWLSTQFNQINQYSSGSSGSSSLWGGKSY